MYVNKSQSYFYMLTTKILNAVLLTIAKNEMFVYKLNKAKTLYGEN
jgi:hypothetical protein